jgi:hypothetical protein
MTAHKTTMTREQFVAAEIFGYSYANYQDHLDIENVRYEQLMPATVVILERASREGWPMTRVATELDTDEQNASELIEAYQRAALIVDAENPAEAFRKAVRFSVLDAVEKGLSTEEAIDSLVTQICFRTADLAYLLDREAKPLSRYSRHLRREPDVGYHEGYFDEDDNA